jgi:hypothetical protein
VQTPDALPTSNAFTSNEKELAENESTILETVVEGLFGAEAKLLDVARVVEEVTVEESFGNGVPSDDALGLGDIEIIAETTIEGSSSFDNVNSVVKSEEDIRKKTGITNVPDPATTAPGELAQTEHRKADALVQTDIVPEIAAAESLKERLKSLIGDLGTASLTKEEVNVFEDMFMDAKEQLYGAGRRGRAAGL